ncbi:MAG: NAD-dependent epimerase/dehydratase family protein [Clostridia bacterium]|nr:NAD-dependent epimerase/dehydratase family protein [Clostridia bacterium]
MISVCIVGPNSYIGASVERRLVEFPDSYRVFKISVRNDGWQNCDLSRYDVVIYAAGIVHQREKKNNRDIYYSVNRDKTGEFARAAKKAGVRQFIFLSSMSVYGMSSGHITKDLEPRPDTHYGKSKLEAENLLKELQSDDFAVAIVRPPLVYGRGCKGNYPRLSRLATTFPIYPRFTNKRSFVYIGNLAEAIKLIIDSRLSGTFFPQNREYVDIGMLVPDIARLHGKKTLLIRGFGRILRITGMMGGTFEKVFGDLTYDMDMSTQPNGYQIYGYEESISLTEGVIPGERP